MTLLVRTGGVALLGFAVIACGGGGDGVEERAIRDVFRAFFDAFEDIDEVKLAGLLNDDCADPEQIAEGQRLSREWWEKHSGR